MPGRQSAHPASRLYCAGGVPQFGHAVGPAFGGACARLPVAKSDIASGRLLNDLGADHHRCSRLRLLPLLPTRTTLYAYPHQHRSPDHPDQESPTIGH